MELGANRLSTLPIADALNQGLCEGLIELAISSNNFTELPTELFSLPRLVKLNVRENSISSVTEDIWRAPCLEELYLSKNKLVALPCPDYVYLKPGMTTTPTQRRIMTFSLGLTSFSSTETRLVESTRQSYMTVAAPGTEPRAGGFRLKTLDLSDNQLTEIPPGLPCLAPQLRTLKLSGNRIDHLGHPCNYPQLLEKLDVNRNACKSCIRWCVEPPTLACAQSRLRNESSPCLHIGHRILGNLKFLFIEDNNLRSLTLEEERRENLSESSSSGLGGSEGGVVDRGRVEGGRERGGREGKGEGLPMLMFPRLECLRLSNNQLERVPAGMHREVELRELKLDRNPGITHLPSNLHLLQELFFFKFEGISDPVVSELRSCSNTPEQLLYLKAREKE